jgi:hypothetical protein
VHGSDIGKTGTRYNIIYRFSTSHIETQPKLLGSQGSAKKMLWYRGIIIGISPANPEISNTHCPVTGRSSTAPKQTFQTTLFQQPNIEN